MIWLEPNPFPTTLNTGSNKKRPQLCHGPIIPTITHTFSRLQHRFPPGSAAARNPRTHWRLPQRPAQSSCLVQVRNGPSSHSSLHLCWMVGGRPTPLKNYQSQLGWLFPRYGKIKMFQTTNQVGWLTILFQEIRHLQDPATPRSPPKDWDGKTQGCPNLKAWLSNDKWDCLHLKLRWAVCENERLVPAQFKSDFQHVFDFPGVQELGKIPTCIHLVKPPKFAVFPGFPMEGVAREFQPTQKRHMTTAKMQWRATAYNLSPPPGSSWFFFHHRSEK